MEPSRTEVRRYDCPACRAKPGSKCIGTRGRPREANHRERVRLAKIEERYRPRSVWRSHEAPVPEVRSSHHERLLLRQAPAASVSAKAALGRQAGDLPAQDVRA